MNTIDLIDSFSEFKEQKNIDKVKMMRLLEDTFKTSLKKKYGNTDNFDVVVNTDKGQIEIYQIRTIVEDDAVADKVKEVGITEAKLIDESFECVLGKVIRSSAVLARMLPRKRRRVSAGMDSSSSSAAPRIAASGLFSS